MAHIIVKTPIGKIAVDYQDDFVTGVQQVADQVRAVSKKDPFVIEIQKQFSAYFSGELKEFNLPFLFKQGTDYQLRVWDQIRKISFGSTITYGEIAKKIKSGPRAVGNACRRNQLLLLVPCHRVVSAAGLGGFMGDSDGSLVQRKQWLLEHEQLKNNV
ncbi:MAG: methylated-DNA--[protein]-cysteine S-methyltransferase [Gammaproteobacteria bacterium]